MGVNENDSWKAVRDRPLAILLSFCVATAAATVAIFQNFIIPYKEAQIADLTRQLSSMHYTEKTVAERDATIAKLREEIAVLTQQVTKLSQENNTIGERDATIAKLREEISVLTQRVTKLSQEDLFSAEDPYPKGLRGVRIGDPLSKLDEVYPEEVKARDVLFRTVSVNVEHFFFSEAVYGYDKTTRPHRIEDISFVIRENSDSNSSNQTLVAALKSQLIERYGEAANSGKDSWEWNVKGFGCGSFRRHDSSCFS